MNETSRGWLERDAAVVWHGFTQMASFLGGEASRAPLMIERAEGRELIDVDGNRYLDAISSLWVTTLGHRVPELDRALIDQVGRIAHSTLLGNGNTVVVHLAEALSRVVPVESPHFLFASDGASAVEQALKVAFQYWRNKGAGAGEHRLFLALGGAYHGDTTGAISLGDSGFESAVFDPLKFEVLRSPGYGDPDWLAAAAKVIESRSGELAAVVVEPLVQAAGGMVVGDPHQVGELGQLCHDAGVLLIADEVATGFGRTGAMFASEICGLRPDLLCIGKGLTGGYLPMSATAASAKVYEAFFGDDLGPETLYHGHSYGGNALAAAVALKHLELMESRHVLDNVRSGADHLAGSLAGSLADHLAVKAIRQQGLMVGVELSPPVEGLRWGRRACAGATRRGVLLRPLGDVVVIMPPLTITTGEIDRIVAVLVESLDELL